VNDETHGARLAEVVERGRMGDDHQPASDAMDSMFVAAARISVKTAA